MISLPLLKINFSLIGRGFNYFRVIKCMLDISSPKITNFTYLLAKFESSLEGGDSTVVKSCSLCQAKIL